MLILFLSLRPVGVDWAGSKVPFSMSAICLFIYLFMFMPPSSVLSLLLFIIHMKPLGEVHPLPWSEKSSIPDDTKLYLCVPGELSDAFDVFSLCLETVKVWMENNTLQLSTGVLLGFMAFCIWRFTILGPGGVS